MKLSELIAAVGDDNIAVQVLDECGHKIDAKTSSAKITFGTDQVCARDMVITGQTPKFGMVIWLPRDKLEAAIAADESTASPTSDSAGEKS